MKQPPQVEQNSSAMPQRPVTPGLVWRIMKFLRACLKKERGWVEDQSQHGCQHFNAQKLLDCCGWSGTRQPRSGVFRQALRSPRAGWLFFGVLMSLWVSFDARGGVGTNLDGSFYVDSDQLTVTVFPVTGLIRVQDKANGAWTWNKRSSTRHTPFANVTLFPVQNAIGFNTSYFPSSGGTSPGLLFTWTELWLDGRALKVKVNIDDHSTLMGDFDCLEPFQPSSSMSVVVPDFNDGHIYPCNLNPWPWYNLDSIKIMNLTMPWVGVVNPANGQGYAVMADTPYDAQLKLARHNGLRSPLIAWNPEKGRFGYTRSLTYHFTASGGYVALAKAYRAHAQSEGLVVTLAEKAQSRTNITKLYGAPFLWDFYAHLPALTLRTLGVAKAYHHVERWDGLGATDAKRNAANALGFITEEYDYYTGGPVDGGSQTYQNYHIHSNQCVRTATGDIQNIGGSEATWGARCSEFFRPVGQGIIPQRLSDDPQTGRYIDQMTQNIDGHDTGPRGGGGAAWECYSATHPKTRTQWVADAVNFYRYLAEELNLITGAELGKFYQVPYTEMFHGIGSWFWPWSDVSFPAARGSNTNDWNTYDNWAINPARRVPLWQLVFHDCAIGTWYPWDGNDISHRFDGHYQDQKDAMNVLSGTPPMFLVTGTSISGSGSQYFSNRPRWLQSYRNTCKLHEAIADKEMLTHAFLTADRLVQQTEWSDGTKIIANFGTNEFFADVGYPYSQLLQQFCFTAKGPWGGVMRSYYYDPARIVTYLWKDGYHFDDEQMSGTNIIALAHQRVAPNNLRVNVDQPGSPVSFMIYPNRVQPVWDFASTRVWSCSAVNGNRLTELSWTRVGDGILVSGLSGFIVLDVVCDPPPPALQINVPASNSPVNLTLIGTPGRPYRIEHVGDLTSTNWEPLLDIPSLLNWTNVLSDPVSMDSQPSRFYRAQDLTP